MCWNCKWETIDTKYFGGRGSFSSEGITMTQYNKMVHGFTVIYQRCKKCGEVKTQEVVGNPKLS